MKKEILIGICCFLTGIGAGLLLAPKQYHIEPSKFVIKELTSQGRAEMQKAISEINLVLNEDMGGIMAERTRALQAITSKKTDRTAADFYLSGMENKMSLTQAKIDKIFLDAVQRMPLVDRQTYMEFYLKNRGWLKSHSVVLPLAAIAGIDEQSLTPALPTADSL